MIPSSTLAHKRRTGIQCQCSGCCEKELTPSIPHSIWRLNEASIIDTLQPNHDEMQAMTALDRFAWKQIAVYLLDIFVLGMTKHLTIVQSEIAPALG